MIFKGDQKDMDLNLAYRQEMMRRAAHHQLVREALAGRGGHIRWYGPLLARVGDGLVRWGTTLQARYGEAGGFPRAVDSWQETPRPQTPRA